MLLLGTITTLQVLAAGGVPPLVALLRSPEPGTKAAGVHALRPLAVYGDVKVGALHTVPRLAIHAAAVLQRQQQQHWVACLKYGQQAAVAGSCCVRTWSQNLGMRVVHVKPCSMPDKFHTVTHALAIYCVNC